MKDSYDCLVVGGGPAGSTVAALVARAGFSTLLVERERMPRCHVGESLMPETYGTLRRLGLWDKMLQSRFLKKTGVQFVSGEGSVSQSFFFHERDPGESSYAWQVERAAFDLMLFDNARTLGATCCDRSRVREALLEGDRVCGVRLETESGDIREVRCRVLVDATGQQALLANQLGLVQSASEAPSAAIWGYYRNAYREPGEAGATTVLLHATDKTSWFWCVPLAEDVSSVGVLGGNLDLPQDRGKLAEVFEDELVKCPALIQRLINAELVSTFHAARQLTYRVSQRAGEGWVLVGDAGGAADPLLGAGVLLGLKSGEWAADAIVDGLVAGDLSAAQLGRWTATFDGGVQRIQNLTQALLSPDFQFGQLVTLHPESKAQLTDLLMGRVFDAGSSGGDGIPTWLRISPGANSLSGGPRLGPHLAFSARPIPASE